MMVTTKGFSALWTVGLVIVLAGLLGHTALAQDKETPVQQEFESSANYKVSLRAPHSVYRHEGADLVVRVRNGQGQPLNGVPVEFQMDPKWAGSASVSPQRVLTQNGTARAMLHTDLIGVVNVTARVGTITKEASIAVRLYSHGSTSTE
jgi:hypothetical protein